MSAQRARGSWRQSASQAAKDGLQASREAAHWAGQRAAIGMRRVRANWQVPVEGTQHLGPGAAIIAVNHLGRQDAARLRGSLNRKVTVLSAVGRGRHSGRAELEQTALTALAAGELVGIFPEGSPSPDGNLGRGDAELARLAIRAQVPIVPAAFCQVDDELGRHLVLKIGEPIDIGRQAKLPELSSRLDLIVLRGITDQVMQAIAELGGQDYRDLDNQQAAAAGSVEISDLQREAEEKFERLRDQMLAAEQEAIAAAAAEQDELLAAVEAARQQAQLATRREQR